MFFSGKGVGGEGVLPQKLMRQGRYEAYKDLDFKDELNVTEFYSQGKNGSVLMRVIFSETDIPDVYNLGFGCVDENDEINDLAVSDNGDRNIILATIYDIVMGYTERYPDRIIYFKGSTPSRTRLYRMAIGMNLDELSEQFLLYGYYGSAFAPFIRT